MFTACKKSSEKEIVGFSFAAQSAVGVIDKSAKSIAVKVPSGTDVSKLTPTIEVSKKASVSPSSGEVQNFKNSVKYTVTAEDGSTEVYTVKVTVSSSGGGGGGGGSGGNYNGWPSDAVLAKYGLGGLSKPTGSFNILHIEAVGVALHIQFEGNESTADFVKNYLHGSNGWIAEHEIDMGSDGGFYYYSKLSGGEEFYLVFIIGEGRIVFMLQSTIQ